MNDTSLLADWEFRNDLERNIAHAVYDALKERLPVKSVEVGWICRSHAINHRFDARCVGQDLSDKRINFFTDGNGNVTRMYIG